MSRKIPISYPDLTGNEEHYVQDAIRSSWISSSGHFVERFEREFAKLCGSASALGTCNGTAALHLALMALGCGSGDEVIVPSLTYIATANAVRYTGAEPVFVDVHPGTWCMDPARLSEAVTPRTAGIIPVHLYGHPAEMDEVMHVAHKHALWVVEDAAEAHGARYKGRPVGSFGDLSIFSFYGNKILTCGEGGVVVDRNGLLDAQLRLLRGQGMDPHRRYYHPVVGYNYRLTNVACAILCAQLERLDEMLRRRRDICAEYRDLLEGECVFQQHQPWVHVAPWMMCVVFESEERKDRVVEALTLDGIESRPFFVPLHTLPPYVEEPPVELPVTERLARNGLCLPTHTGLSSEDIQRVVRSVRDA